LDLGGKAVYVQKNTSFHRRLIHLSEEIGQKINIIADSVFDVEELVAKVANHEIDYTICDENVARLNKTYYPNIDVSLDISFPQNIAWAIPKGTDSWKIYLDNWIAEFRKTKRYAVLYHRYFESPRIVNRMNSGWHSISGGKISNYDPIIKQNAKESGWDWRLIAAIIYQESRFNPEIESWAGAYGLMQVMPETAEALGIEDYTDPAQNIKAGVSMLNWLDRQLAESVPDSTQRIKFVMAAYNVGLGHVKDAQRLAEKYGKDNQIWDGNVDYFLLHKSSEKYFKDPVVQWGYCLGEQPYNYVKKVTQNYMHYLNVIPES
jgi:membrane-bound lytic murein transglycosylase F